jgi:hypothetical protein
MRRHDRPLERHRAGERHPERGKRDEAEDPDVP